MRTEPSSTANAAKYFVEVSMDKAPLNLSVSRSVARFHFTSAAGVLQQMLLRRRKISTRAA